MLKNSRICCLLIVQDFQFSKENMTKYRCYHKKCRDTGVILLEDTIDWHFNHNHADLGLKTLTEKKLLCQPIQEAEIDENMPLITNSWLEPEIICWFSN